MDNNYLKFQEILTSINKNTNADDFMLNYYLRNSSLTRFANNMVTQNVSNEIESISLTIYLNQKKATLKTSNLSKENLINLIKTAELVCKHSAIDKEYLPTLANDNQDISDCIDYNILNSAPSDMAETVHYAINNAKKNNATAFGTYTSGILKKGVATKNGLNKFHQQTFAEYKNTVDKNGEKSSAKSSAAFLKNINNKEVFEEALSDASAMKNRKSYAPGRYDVVFSSEAMHDLYRMMYYLSKDRKAADKGHSALKNKIGQKIADKRINIYTDANDEKLPTIPFTADGLPINKRFMIKNGILNDITTSRYWAKHNNLSPWEMNNLIISEGDCNDYQLISQVENGFYIKELWYIRLVRDEDLTMTGMTRNALFKIEDGKLCSGATHFRFNDSPLLMLNRVKEIGKHKISLPACYWSLPSMIPSMLIKDFYLSSSTLF